MTDFAHDDRSLNAVARNVADAYYDRTVVKLDGVVPIAADFGLLRRR